MQRPGRQGSPLSRAEIGDNHVSTGIARQTLRAASLSAQAALVVLAKKRGPRRACPTSIPAVSA